MRVALFLLLALPLAMAGLPRGMDMEDMYKMMMAHQNKGSDHDKDEDKKDGGMSGDSWEKFMEHKGWGEDKGWGDDKSDEDDDHSEEFARFMKYMKEQKEEEEHEKKHEHMKKYMMAFKEYINMKKHKEEEARKMKMALHEQMKMIEMKKKMTEQLYNVSMEFAKKKLMFTYGVTFHFLEFCHCDESKDIFMRLKEGRFGHMEYAGNGGMYDDGMDGVNGTSAGANHGDDGDMDVYRKPSHHELMEFVKKFAHMSHEDQVKHVLHDLVKVMCGAAKQFFTHLKQVEHYLIEYRRHQQSGQH